MNITEYKDAIKICQKANVPLMAWGPGGVGKTSGAKQAAEELKIDFISWTGPILSPPEVVGVPYEKDGVSKWSIPEIIPRKGKGLILIDELPDSPETMQKVYYTIILEHRANTHKIPEGWYVMGAGNRPEDGGFSSDMPAPLITRFCHVGVYCDAPDFSHQTPNKADVDVNDFIKWSVKNFHPYIAAFLKFRQDYIYCHQATPRTWEYISRLLNSTEDHFSFVFKEVIKGTVGQGIGIEFNNFILLANKIPSIDAICTNPNSVDVPEETSILYALIMGLIARINDDNASNIIKYIGRVNKEFQFFFHAYAKERYPKIVANKEYINWINRNKESLM